MPRSRSKTVILTCIWLLLARLGVPDLHAEASTGVIVSRFVSSGVLSPSDENAQLSGTVVDASGAVITGATVLLRNADDTLHKTTLSDKHGSFVISGIAAGAYRLILSSPGFEMKSIPITLETNGTQALLRISLSVAQVTTILEVQGRENDLTGIADSGTQGTVGAKELAARPILRSGEVLETVPGLIITQHAGGGKANQYFLRGFNLDHGTDIAIFLDDMPLNLPSHAHGEGYADMNIVMPEFLQRVNFEKGPYYANVGNFGAAGAVHLECFKTLPQNFLKVEGGMFGYGRLAFGVSRKLALGKLLYGGEVYHDNGPWSTHEDNYFKYNGLATYSQGDEVNGFSSTARAYRGTWHSSDQIPVDAVPLVGYFGALNPTDGGASQRYSLQGEWHHQTANSTTSVMAYGFYYDLDLFSDFTYYLDDPNKGDQFEQQDRRWVAGLDAHHTVSGQWLARKMENTLGLQVRNDWVHNGLFRTDNRVRIDKNDGNACNDETISACANDPNLVAVLPAATDLNEFTDTILSAYFENRVQWAKKFRSVLAVRGDDAEYIVTSLTPTYISSVPPLSAPVDFSRLNSGTATRFTPQPKLSLIFGPWSNTEFYIQGGFSFHSNDARGATQREQPISPANPFPAPSTPIPPLVQLKGGEFGVRTPAAAHLQSTLSLWYLRSNSELLQDGDTGGTVASEQPSNRYGLEWANYYTPTEHLAVDLDIADSRAQFTQTDPADAAYTNLSGGQYPVQGPGGKLVPEAVRVVSSSGLTLHDYKGFTSTLRLRYFGPRDLTSDGNNRSKATLLLNAGVAYQFNKRWSLSADLFNLLNRRNDDITYAYISRITPIATASFTNVFHAAEPFQIRFRLERTF
jgi:outer membrane receptor protein involved in Fe transport